jgi:hypothetical protein
LSRNLRIRLASHILKSAHVLDGRQSAAAAIQRGVRRLLAQRDMVSLAEVSLASGRCADIMAIGPDGTITIVEIKSCRADFMADRKWADYRAFCDRFYFAVDASFPLAVLPEGVGLIMADSFGAETLQAPESHPLVAARRKAVTLRFARKAASALHAIADPEGVRVIS